jgi:hypothetical protein
VRRRSSGSTNGSCVSSAESPPAGEPASVGSPWFSYSVERLPMNHERPASTGLPQNTTFVPTVPDAANARKPDRVEKLVEAVKVAQHQGGSATNRRLEQADVADVALVALPGGYGQPREKNDGDLAALLDEICGFIREHIVISEDATRVIALWVAYTHVYEEFDHAPYLAVLSALKRSGKTTLLCLIGWLCARGWAVVHTSEATLYRKIEKDKPTVLIDEIDAIFKPNRDTEGLRAVINAGHTKGLTIPRMGGKNNTELEEFSPFGPKAFSGIGFQVLPDTVQDRSIPIEIKRKAPGEERQRVRTRRTQPIAEELRHQLETWARSRDSSFEDVWPDCPDQLDHRAVDIFEPLFAVADSAGGDWPQAARTIAVELMSSVERDSETNLELLRAIYPMLEQIDKISSHDLIIALCVDEEAPWRTWWWDPKAADGVGAPKVDAQRKLARRLGEFGIKSHVIRLESKTPRGYRREDFEDAWRRYGIASSPCLPEGATSATSATSQEESGLERCADRAHVAQHNRNGTPAKRIPSPGDEGYRKFIANKRGESHLTHREWRQRLALHKLLVPAS